MVVKGLAKMESATWSSLAGILSDPELVLGGMDLMISQVSAKLTGFNLKVSDLLSFSLRNLSNFISELSS